MTHELDPAGIASGPEDAFNRYAASEAQRHRLVRTNAELQEADVLAVHDGKFKVLDLKTVLSGAAQDYSELILRPENFGGRGLRNLNSFVSLTGSNSVGVGTGTSKRMRISVPGIAANAFKPGTIVTVSGAMADENNGQFTVHAINRGDEYIDLMNADVVDDPTGVVTISGFNYNIQDQTFFFDANGDAATTEFDNYNPLLEMFGHARGLNDAGKPFATTLLLGQAIYPMTGGVDMTGIKNMTLRGLGRTASAIVHTDGTSFSPEKPHMFFSVASGNEEYSSRLSFQDLSIQGARTFDADNYGDGYETGQGDILHIRQKIGADDDHTPSSSQYVNTMGGVDMQLEMFRTSIEGANRHNITLRGRGDHRIFFNNFGNANCVGLQGEFYDSKMGYNIASSCGENALRLRAGCNDIQIYSDHYYFCGSNKVGRLTDEDSFETVVDCLATASVNATNIKMLGCRLEDTSGPALHIGTRAAMFKGDLDCNNPMSLGPFGSDRDFSYLNLDIGTSPSGGDWFGADGLPLVYVADDTIDLLSIKLDLWWRHSRATQGASSCVRVGASKTGTIADGANINIYVGVHPNRTSRPAVDAEPEVWAAGDPSNAQHFSGDYIASEDADRYALLMRNWHVYVDGVSDRGFHGRIRRAQFEDYMSNNDRIIPFNLLEPVRVVATQVERVSETEARLSLSGSPPVGRRFDAVEVSGFVHSENNGRFKVTSLSSGSITIENIGLVEETGAVATVIQNAQGVIHVPSRQEVGKTREYVLLSAPANAQGDQGSIIITGLADGSQTATLDVVGQTITTKVNHLGQETVV